MSKDGKAADGASKKSSKKKIIIIVLILLAFGGGGAGSYFLFVPHPEEPEPPPEPGIVIPLEAITINLADGHFLKLRIALQATAEVAEALDGSKALDIAIDLFSNRPIAELSSNDERKRIKQELAEHISEAYEKEIMDIYFTEFVMQ
ncbi:MAG: flagellar basal body-associated FliL family protein [Dactylosporangium sp.]|nr:flagellar basal body-associated FliL family protein [Dactylosporangium sp.]NNJ61286.1 flagellar basal body-associated FliL family protein [Dactylosporangium sp.]